MEVTGSQSLILPFEHFAYSEHQTATKADTLKLVFATHEVVLRGHALRRVEAAVQRMELSLVAAVPDRFRSLIGEGQPFIEEIEVTSAAALTAMPENPPIKEGGGARNGSDD